MEKRVKFSFEGDPTEYALEFDFNELADAEAVAGCDLLLAVRKWPQLSCQEMRGLLYALSKPAHPKVTLKDAGALLTHNLFVAMAGMRAALLAAALLEEKEMEEGLADDEKRSSAPLKTDGE